MSAACDGRGHNLFVFNTILQVPRTIILQKANDQKEAPGTELAGTDCKILSRFELFFCMKQDIVLFCSLSFFVSSVVRKIYNKILIELKKLRIVKSSAKLYLYPGSSAL